jgi:hypothetical protein
VVDLGGGPGVRHVPEEPLGSRSSFADDAELQRAFQLQSQHQPQLVLEPAARSSHARA